MKFTPHGTIVATVVVVMLFFAEGKSKSWHFAGSAAIASYVSLVTHRASRKQEEQEQD